MIERAPASFRDPDSDLGDRLVVTGVGALTPAEIEAALAAGAAEAERMRHHGLIEAAFLALRGRLAIVGRPSLRALNAA